MNGNVLYLFSLFTFDFVLPLLKTPRFNPESPTSPVGRSHRSFRDPVRPSRFFLIRNPTSSNEKTDEFRSEMFFLFSFSFRFPDFRAALRRLEFGNCWNCLPDLRQKMMFGSQANFVENIWKLSHTTGKTCQLELIVLSTVIIWYHLARLKSPNEKHNPFAKFPQ